MSQNDAHNARVMRRSDDFPQINGRQGSQLARHSLSGDYFHSPDPGPLVHSSSIGNRGLLAFINTVSECAIWMKFGEIVPSPLGVRYGEFGTVFHLWGVRRGISTLKIPQSGHFFAIRNLHLINFQKVILHLEITLPSVMQF